jgi:hypothetical protein
MRGRFYTQQQAADGAARYAARDVAEYAPSHAFGDSSKLQKPAIKINRFRGDFPLRSDAKVGSYCRKYFCRCLASRGDADDLPTFRAASRDIDEPPHARFIGR